jgi:hypothetical protein
MWVIQGDADPARRNNDYVLRAMRMGQNVFSIGAKTIKLADVNKPDNVLATQFRARRGIEERAADVIRPDLH